MLHGIVPFLLRRPFPARVGPIGPPYTLYRGMNDGMGCLGRARRGERHGPGGAAGGAAFRAARLPGPAGGGVRQPAGAGCGALSTLLIHSREPSFMPRT